MPRRQPPTHRNAGQHVLMERHPAKKLKPQVGRGNQIYCTNRGLVVCTASMLLTCTFRYQVFEGSTAFGASHV